MTLQAAVLWLQQTTQIRDMIEWSTDWLIKAEDSIFWIALDPITYSKSSIVLITC
jgi:hypothetical protein